MARFATTTDGTRRWVVPVVVAVVAAIVGSLVVVLFVDTKTAGATVLLERAASPGPDPFTRSVTIGEVADFPDSIAPITRTVTADLSTDPTTGGLTTTGNTPGLYGGTGDSATCDPTQLAGFLGHNPDKAAAWARTLGITTRAIPAYIKTLTPVVLTTDTRVTNHGYRNGAAPSRQAVLQAGTAVLVDAHGVPRVKCGCGNPLTEPTSEPIDTTTGTAWPNYRPATVTTITPAPKTQDQFTLTNITTGHTYDRPTGATSGTWLAITDKGIVGPSDYAAAVLASTDAGHSWNAVASDCAACDFMTTLAYGGGTWVATGVSQGDGFVEASSDGGKTWKAASPAAPGSQEPLGAAAYGDGHWIALGQAAFPSKAAVEYTSTDGAHWSPVAASGLPSDDISAVDWHWNSVTFGGGTWVALATECAGTCHDSLMFTSTDGTHWHQSDHSFNDEAVAAYGNGLWIVAANRGRGVGVDVLVGARLRSRRLHESGPAALGEDLGAGVRRGDRLRQRDLVARRVLGPVG